MNPERIHDALNDLDEDLIISVQQLRTGNRKTWKHWAAIAACFCLLITCAFAAKEFSLLPIDPTPPATGITPTNATQATPTDAPITPTDTGSVDSSQSGTPQTAANPITTLAPTEGIYECPSILITVSAWEDSGFLGEVSGFVDTDIFPVGTAVSVQFTQDIGIDVLEGDVLRRIPGPPDADDFPTGSTVCVQFCRFETNSDGSVTLHAGVLSSVRSIEKDG